MTVLSKDPFARSHLPGAGIAGRARRRPSALVFVFVFTSLALLVLSRIEHPVVPAIRATVTTALLPVLDVASVPAQAIGRAADRAVSLSDAFAEVERLQLENQRLRQWERRAIQLERDLEALREHLRVAEEVPGRFVTGRLVADGRGPFVRSALLNVGSNSGVNNGLAVVDQDGLLGRIVDVTQTAARVLYLTDVNSRIPVYAGTGSIRAILNGNNTDRPELKFLPRPHPLNIGDVVYTSGQGGLFPRGMRIGVIEQLAPVVTVRPEARIGRSEYASVLLFGGPRMETEINADAIAGAAPSVRRAAVAQ